MNSINTHILPPPITPQQKQGSEQSYNRNSMGNRPHHQSRSFESMLGKSDSHSTDNAQQCCASDKPAMGNLENGGDKQSDFDNKYSQILKLLQQLIDLIQKLQTKADDKASQPVDNSESSAILPPPPPQLDQPIPVESDNGTGGGSPSDLPLPSSDISNIPAEEIDFPIDPDDLTGTSNKDGLPHISVSDPGRFENEPELVEAETKSASADNPVFGKPPAPPQFDPINQPIPVEPDNGTGGGSPSDLPLPSSDIPNIPAEKIDFPIDPDDLTDTANKDDLPPISVSDPGRFENEPELVEEDIKELDKLPVSIKEETEVALMESNQQNTGDWITHVIDVDPNFNQQVTTEMLDIDSYFSLDVPSGTEYQPLQGIDSIVGKINTPEYSLSFDLGHYGGTPLQFEGHENYQTKNIEVDGKKATIVTYFNPDRIEHPYSIAFNLPLGEQPSQPSILGSGSLSLHARLDSADQYSEVEKILKSIKI